MKITCTPQLNCQTQQLCTVAKIQHVSAGDAYKLEKKAKTLGCSGSSRNGTTLVLYFSSLISDDLIKQVFSS